MECQHEGCHRRAAHEPLWVDEPEAGPFGGELYLCSEHEEDWVENRLEPVPKGQERPDWLDSLW